MVCRFKSQRTGATRLLNKPTSLLHNMIDALPSGYLATVLEVVTLKESLQVSMKAASPIDIITRPSATHEAWCSLIGCRL